MYTLGGQRTTMNFVNLVLKDDAPLGIELQSSSEGGPAVIPTVSKFSKGGQAEAECTKANLDPDLFRGAAVLGINGEKWNSDKSDAFNKQLSDTTRPISIVFGMRQDSNISDAINVSKRYDGNFVELIFRDKVLGLQLDNKNDNVLNVLGLVEGTESERACKECLMDPKCFHGATFVRINGKGGDKNEIYRGLKCPKRPKSVLFELSPVDTIRQIQPLSSPSRNRNRLGDRRASIKMRDRAVFATKSVRKLSVETQNENTLMFNVNESIRQLIIEEEEGVREADRRRGLSDLSDVSRSMRQLQISMAEMEELNAQNDQETLLAEMEELNAIHEKEALKVSKSTSTSGADISSPRAASARRILRGLRARRFKKRTESGRSVETETSNNSIDIDGDFESEEEKAKALEFLKEEAYKACLDAIQQHLDAFLSETPNVSYEEWIEELHPENAQSMRNLVRGRSIDHRFYVEESDHRRLWNEHLGDGEREFVPVMEYLSPDKHQAASKTPPKSFCRSPPARSN